MAHSLQQLPCAHPGDREGGREARSGCSQEGFEAHDRGQTPGRGASSGLSCCSLVLPKDRRVMIMHISA